MSVSKPSCPCASQTDGCGELRYYNPEGSEARGVLDRWRVTLDKDPLEQEADMLRAIASDQLYGRWYLLHALPWLLDRAKTSP